MEERLSESEVTEKIENLKNKMLQNKSEMTRVVYGMPSYKLEEYTKKKQKNRTRNKLQKQSRKRNR